MLKVEDLSDKQTYNFDSNRNRRSFTMKQDKVTTRFILIAKDDGTRYVWDYDLVEELVEDGWYTITLCNNVN